MAGFVVAIDQGTTGTTVLVLDETAEVRGRGYSEFRQHFPRPGWVEHDPEEIFTVSMQVVGAALEDAGVAASDVAAIGITNQRETTLIWDRRTGEPVYRAIVWQDRRTKPFCDRMTADGLSDMIRSKTGLVIDPYFSGTKVRWLLDNVDGVRERAERGELAFGTIETWMIWKLTGGRLHITDVTNASRTLMLDIGSVDWDDELLSVLGVPRELLPEIRPSSQVYGETDPDAFFGSSVPVAGAVGDQQAALFAQACFAQGQAKNTYGTGSFVLMNTGHDPVEKQKSLLRTIAYGLDGSPVEYALEGAILVTGSAVQWLRDELKIIDKAEDTEELARSLDSNDDVYFVPALAGLGAPHWDASARGTLLGVTRGTTKAHLARAVLESIAWSTYDVVDAMQRESGVSVDELRVDGAATGNRWLMQFQSDVLGIPLDVPTNTETTSLGSAYLAGLATGVYPHRDELARLRTTAITYEPSMKTSTRDALHERWLQAVEHAKGWARDDD
ncbi:MAG TPA: glycerol kinase GlpK [Frankiaceae bacterium]|nr:glycerol kinase GlpK [Frankiaceae bacterium]